MEMLLREILEELRQQNKTLREVAGILAAQAEKAEAAQAELAEKAAAAADLLKGTPFAGMFGKEG